MESQRWEQVKSLFGAAVERPSEGRLEWLAGACGDDRGLYREITALLAADGVAEEVLGSVLVAGLSLFEGRREPPAKAAPQPSEAALQSALGRVGGAVGAYRLESVLGSGGTSTVYRARSREGEVVAVKVLLAELAHLPVAERFATEGRLLARLDHPHIARLIDAGVGGDGLPYVVTEYVEGEPIGVSCRRRGLSLEGILELFREICGAVHFAHRNLVLHRDLKPSNILITRDGQPKLLDFGLGKLLETTGPGAQLTVTAQRMLTPSAASPEQVRGEALTTATDVYSLGVLLYQLVSGRHPFHRWQGSAGDLARATLEEEPVAPSRVAGEETSRPVRGSFPARRSRHPAGDLDDVILKALRKEPGQRYGSAEQLGEDLKRYLTGLPVLARKGTWTYRAGKFLHRHRAGAAAGALLVLALVVFSGVTVVQEHRMARAREEAELALDLLVDLLGGADPKAPEGQTLSALDLLDRSAERIPRELAGKPEVQATLLDAIGRVYLNLSSFERAEPLLEQAVGLRREARGASPVELARSLTHLADLRQMQGEYSVAEELYQESLSIRQRELEEGDPEIAEGLNDLADVLSDQGHFAEAEPYYRQALELRQEHLGDEHPDVAESLNDLGLLYHTRGDLVAAEPLYRQALELRRRLLGDHPEVAETMNNLAAVLRSTGHPEEAETLFREALAISRRLLGDHHTDLAPPLQNLALVLLDRRDLEGAESLLLEAMEITASNQGPDHPDQATQIYHLGLVRQAQGSREEAEGLYQQALGIYDRALEPDHLWISYPLLALGRELIEGGRAGEAEPYLRRALAIRAGAHGEDHWRTAEAASVLGGCLVEEGRREEGEAYLRPSLAILERDLGAEDTRFLWARSYLRRASGEEVAPSSSG